MGSWFSSVKSSATDTTKKGETFLERNKMVFELAGAAVALMLFVAAAYFVMIRKKPRGIPPYTLG